MVTKENIWRKLKDNTIKNIVKIKVTKLITTMIMIKVTIIKEILPYRGYQNLDLKLKSNSKKLVLKYHLTQVQIFEIYYAETKTNLYQTATLVFMS